MKNNIYIFLNAEKLKPFPVLL